MNSQPELNSLDRPRITLEVVPEDSHVADPALVDAVGRDAIDALRTDGYTFEPVYTGQRGGFLVDVLIPSLNTAWANRDIILADGSAAITIITPIVALIQHLRKAHEKRVGKEAFQQAPIKITVEINGVPVSIEASELETTENILRFVQRFQTEHSAIAAQMTAQSHVKVIGSVPNKPSRKRHKER